MVAAGTITVAVRVRPPTTHEASRLPEPCYDTSIRGDGTLSAPSRTHTTTSVREIVQIVDDRILTFDPPDPDPSRAFVERGFVPPGTKRYKDKRFMFDRVLSNEAQQQDVYDATARPLLEPLLNGFNATIFAYGATGCGKTHTISGTDSDPGIIYLTMADLFQRIEDRRDEYTVDVMVTFLEIYNEEIRDLLAEPSSPSPRGGLQIWEDKTVKVTGLTELRPQSAEEVKEIVLLGNTRRTQSPTHANETSSRSHAVLQIHVTQSSRTASVTEQKTMGTLSIIDLAGSERAAATTNMGQRMVEGANINKSLLALGNCINALCESGGAVRHVPYRNSKLTRLLKFSLGGNCKTVMIVCIAPTSIHFDDTHNTLLYAERATKIKTKVVTRNVVNVDRHVGRYVEAINRLNLEVAELRAKLTSKASGETEIMNRKRAEAAAEAERVRRDLQAKVEQTQPSLADGSLCEGRISAARTKLAAIRARLAQLDDLARDAPLSNDLEAERGLLRAMAGPEETATAPDSALNTRLYRSQNAGNMFEATLKAVSERRSDRLNEEYTEIVKLDARVHKAEMERAKAQARSEADHAALEGYAQVVVSLVGMMGRCNVLLAEAGSRLQATIEGGNQEALPALAALISSVAVGNDETFTALIGQSTAAYVAATTGTSSLDNFKSHPPLPRPLADKAGSATLLKGRSTRRSSTFSTTTTSSPRLSFKSPRKSMRNSLSGAGAPYLRLPVEKEKKKSVQWRDHAGQGRIDDADVDPFSSPPPPATRTSTASTAGHSQAGPSGIPRPSSVASSVAGSESDWEDDRTDDAATRLLSVPTNAVRAVVSSKRRPSRLDPSFLKSKAPSTLSSLAEDDGEESTPRRLLPLASVNTNRVKAPSSLMISNGSSTLSNKHLPSSSIENSPTKHASGARVASSAGKSLARRRSNAGPIRSEKTRRRSSMIPHLSPKNQNTRASASEDHPDGFVSSTRRIGNSLGPATVPPPRRVMVSDVGKSPAKRAKRMSLLNATAARISRLRPLSSPMVLASSVPADPNSSADISFSGRPKPTWR